jgi:hypothetical protein
MLSKILMFAGIVHTPKRSIGREVAIFAHAPDLSRNGKA